MLSPLVVLVTQMHQTLRFSGWPMRRLPSGEWMQPSLGTSSGFPVCAHLLQLLFITGRLPIHDWVHSSLIFTRGACNCNGRHALEEPRPGSLQGASQPQSLHSLVPRSTLESPASSLDIDEARPVRVRTHIWGSRQCAWHVLTSLSRAWYAGKDGWHARRKNVVLDPFCVPRPSSYHGLCLSQTLKIAHIFIILRRETPSSCII